VLAIPAGQQGGFEVAVAAGAEIGRCGDVETGYGCGRQRG
jgi:hypothetical protein